MDKEAMDQLNEGFVAIPRMLKAVFVRFGTIGAELAKEQQLRGDGFADFVRTELPFDMYVAQLFMALAATPGLEAANFTPPVAVAMPRLLEVMGQIVCMWSTISGGTVPENNTGTTAASEAVSDPDCEASADAPVTDDDAEADIDDTAPVGITPITTSETPTATDEVASAAAPTGNDRAADQKVAGVAITDILSGTTAPVEQADAPADSTPVAAGEPPTRGQKLTAEQHQYLRDRSVTLLVKVKKGELPVEEAMRQAEKMPKRKTK